jgi:hypothetical protein
MPSLTLWAERDFDIDLLERYCRATRRGLSILLELWISKTTALANMAALIEDYSNKQDDEQVLNNFLEDKVADRIVQALFQYARAGAPIEAQHVKGLKRCLVDHDQKLPGALKLLREASIRMSQVSAELNEARREKAEADKKLLTEVTSKAELEKRFTPSAMGTSQLPSSALNIISKCEDRIRQAQEKQLVCGQRVTELRELLDEVTESCMSTRRESLQIIENLEKRKLNGIAATSSEILTLQLALSSALVKETTGIISLEKSPVVLSPRPGAAVNTSTLSSAGSAGVATVAGEEWIEKILAMDPSERSLFELGQIAEALASHESEEEIKISDLEREIEKMKSQIRELEQGSGAFADRLAADYAGMAVTSADKGSKPPTSTLIEKLMRVSPKFSLPLPLKQDCYAGDFWRGFAIEENHESDIDFLVDLPWVVPELEEASTAAGNSGHLSKSPLGTPGVPLSEREWDIIAYEHVLLGYFEITTRYPHLLTGSHWNKLKTAIHALRLKLKIPTKMHEQLTELILPDSVAIQDEIAPLDFRFRLLRLLAKMNSSSLSADVVDAFLKRQVAYIDLCVRCMQKEDQSGTIDSSIVPLTAVLVSSILNKVPIEDEVVVELLEALGTYAEETLETSQLVIPRGALHQTISRIWKLCVSLDQENGLCSDLNVVASFVHNFLTGRQYPYHQLWLGLALWEEAKRSGPSLPGPFAKQTAEILKPGTKWLDKLSGDVFWFGRGTAGASSIHSASPSMDSPTRNNMNESFRSSGEQSSTGNGPSPSSDLTSRVLGFDMAYILKLTVGSRDSMVSALCDYRKSLDPEALEQCFEAFKHLMNRTNNTVPTFLWPADVDWNAFLRTMGEHFISESARSVCNRLVEPERFLDSVSVARAHANDESRSVWMGEVTAAVWQVIFEFACEMEVYSLAWTKSTELVSKHRLIWTKGLQSRIRAVVDLMNRDDDLWLPDRVPPGGQDLLAVLQVWQRISGDGDLTEIIRPKISRALLLHLDKVERDSLPSVLHNNHADFGQSWQATRPPQILHSTKCVDLWTTIFTALQACIDSASAQMAMGTCAQMVVRCVERYCDNAREGFPNDLALAHPLMIKARRAFTRLLMHSEDETELPEIFKSKKKRKNRLFKRDSGGNGTNPNVSAEESDDGHGGRNASLSLGSEGLNLIGDNHLFLSDYLVVTSRLGSQDATALMVRLHDLAFSLGELEKARNTLSEAIEKEHNKLSRLYLSQAKFANMGDQVQVLPKLAEPAVKAMIEAISQGINEASQILTNTADVVAKYLGVNLVFIQEKENLFERLYMPSCRDYPLALVMKNYKSIAVFAQMAPLKWRTEIVRAVLANFILAWVYVICDMVSRGRVFKEADASVMRNDFDALGKLAEDLGLKHDSQTQDLLRYSGSLPDYVSGSNPTELKTECERALAEPYEKSKSKSRLAVGTSNKKK